MNQDSKQVILNDTVIANNSHSNIVPNRPNFMNFKIAAFTLGK
jgi:hypothetical protein